METTRERVFEQSAGRTLRGLREAHGLSLEDVAARTKVPANHLAMIEEDAYAELPPDVYTTIYLKAYCKAFDLDSGPIIAHFQSQRTTRGPSQVMERKHPAAGVRITELVAAPRLIRTVAVVIAASGLALYFILQLFRLVTPPMIALSAPQDGIITADRSVAVDGHTEPGVAIAINGKAVAVDGQGKFHDTFALQDGLNIIEIAGMKTYSKPMVVTRRVIVTPTVVSAPSLIDDTTPSPGVQSVLTLPGTP